MNNLFFDKSDLKYCGKNVIIGKTVRIKKPEQVHIGDNVIIDDYTYISGDTYIGDYVHIAPGCVLSASAGGIEMQALSGLSAGCKVYGGSSNYLKIGLDMPTIPAEHRYNAILEKTVIESFGLIGANCIILPGCRIPQGLAVAASLIVRKNIQLRPWHCLIDQDGKLLPRRGLDELKKRIQNFYPIEIQEP